MDELDNLEYPDADDYQDIDSRDEEDEVNDDGLTESEQNAYDDALSDYADSIREIIGNIE